MGIFFQGTIFPGPFFRGSFLREFFSQGPFFRVRHRKVYFVSYGRHRRFQTEAAITQVHTSMFPTRCTRYFVHLPQTEMRFRSELRRRSYRFLKRFTDYQHQFRGYILLCRRGTHNQVVSVLCHSLSPIALLSTATFF